MSPNAKENVLTGLTVLSGLCTAVLFFVDRPILFCILLLVTIALLIWRRFASSDLPVEGGTVRESETAKPVQSTTAKQKKWIDCAYCQGSGSLTTYYDEHTQKNEACGICQGHGQILTDLWSRPACRRCGGSGRLVSKQYTPTLHRIGYGYLQHHQFDTHIEPCDICGGIGRRPWQSGEAG